MGEEYFKKALSNFINETAVGGGIRHLADLGFVPSQIKDRLDFPMPLESVRNIYYKYLLDSGKVRLKKPEEEGFEKVSYVKDTDQYGNQSFRRVTLKTDATKGKYYCINFGAALYKDKAALQEKAAALSGEDREYVLGLPWPLYPVYHMADDRIERIIAVLGESND